MFSEAKPGSTGKVTISSASAISSLKRPKRSRPNRIPVFSFLAARARSALPASTGLRTTTYHVDVPSFGDWGFVLAARGAAPVPSVDPAVAADLRFLDGDVLAAATVFPRDRDRDRYDVEVSTLDRPRILEYEARGWRGY